MSASQSVLEKTFSYIDIYKHKLLTLDIGEHSFLINTKFAGRHQKGENESTKKILIKTFCFHSR